MNKPQVYTLAEVRHGTGWSAYIKFVEYTPLQAAAPALLEALEELYNHTAEYITINHLGDVHHNMGMQMARAALAQAKDHSTGYGLSGTEPLTPLHRRQAKGEQS